MKRTSLTLVVAVALFLGVAPVGTGEEEAPGIEWMTDLDAANAKAAKEGRPVLVVFR